MKTAIIHYWLVGMRGGERVLESICRLFPDADIYTHAYDPSNISKIINNHKVETTFISKFPRATKYYSYYLPFMPLALEELDLQDYDLVISSESGPAKGIITRPDALHLCYCHSPLRYIWDQYPVYKKHSGLLLRTLWPFVATGMRKWDVTSAARVDGIMANSTFVAQRVKKFWRREAEVVFPPVRVSEFEPAPASEISDSYLWIGELVPYKRPDIAIDAFNKLGLPLTVIGGPEKASRALEKRAKSNIKFLGKVSNETLQHHLARCKALIFPGTEDFGIVPVEATASGRPVIAYDSGGVRDTIIHGQTGYLFGDQSAAGLEQAITQFETDMADNLDIPTITKHAERFSEAAFHEGFKAYLSKFGVNP